VPNDSPRLSAARLKSDQLEHIYIAGIFLANGDFKVFNVIVPDVPQNVKMPLMAFDESGLETLKRYAQAEANETGQTVSIISFKDHKICDNLHPVNNSTGG
jgi:hypothetical protein